MKRRACSLTVASALMLAIAAAAAAPAAEPPRTLRLDYFHTGNAADERFSLDRLVLEPLPWPGDPASRSTTPTSASTSSR